MTFKDATIEAIDGTIDSPEGMPLYMSKIDCRRLRTMFANGNARRTKRAEEMTRRFLARHGVTVKDDWSLSSIDWIMVLKFLIAILPLLLAII